MDTTELQEIADKIEFLRQNMQLTYSNLFLHCKILSSQYLSLKVKRLFKDFLTEDDVFIYSHQEDPNICQLTMHKPWTRLVFAWVRPDGIYLFGFPKDMLPTLGLYINHADSTMMQTNTLFKQSIRLTFERTQELGDFLIEIL